MAEPKSQTSFTKDYIEKRIESRVASLESRVAKMQEEGLALTARQAEGDGKYLDDLHADLMGMANRVHKARLDIKGKPDVEVVDIVNKVAGRMNPTTTRDGLSHVDRSRLQELFREREQAEREIAMIQHALAYLKESPVDLYSITALKQLGLLDAVKFTLELPAERKKSRRGW